jgi:hypothetical protein
LCSEINVDVTHKYNWLPGKAFAGLGDVEQGCRVGRWNVGSDDRVSVCACDKDTTNNIRSMLRVAVRRPRVRSVDSRVSVSTATSILIYLHALRAASRFELRPSRML